MVILLPALKFEISERSRIEISERSQIVFEGLRGSSSLHLQRFQLETSSWVFPSTSSYLKELTQVLFDTFFLNSKQEHKSMTGAETFTDAIGIKKQPQEGRKPHWLFFYRNIGAVADRSGRGSKYRSGRGSRVQVLQ